MNLTAVSVCWLLARLPTTDTRVFSLPSCLVHRAQSLCPIAPVRIDAQHRLSHVPLLHARKLVFQPCGDLQKDDDTRLLGPCNT